MSHMCAALAQSVERRLGKAEVGGSIPLGSLKKYLLKALVFKGFYVVQKKKRQRRKIYGR